MQNRGNALFLILIAVALFAALSYAITQSGRGGGSTQRENEMLLGAQLAQTMGAVNTAVMRFSFSGVSYENMKFHSGPNGDCAPSYVLCNTGSDCLFSPEGGGLTLHLPPADAFAVMDDGIGLPGQPATLGKSNIWVDCNEDLFDWGMGTSAPDRTFYFQNLKQDVCRGYNKAIGVSGIPNEDAGVDVTGKEMGYCYKQAFGPNTGDYEIFNVLYVQ